MNEAHHRRSIRLPEYDYSQPGAYFITLAAFRKQMLFGEVVNAEMQLNEYGKIVEEAWTKTSQIRGEIELGEYVIMPNHFHAIVVIHECPVGAYGHTPLQPSKFTSPSRTLGALVRGFKGSVAKSINLLRQTPGQPVWQRNYYEHIIRDKQDLQMISDYILANPASWESDKYRQL